MKLNREKSIFFGKDPDYIIEKLRQIDKNLSKKILKRFNKERDRSNFISNLAELKFINQFSKLNFRIEYEKKYKLESIEKTPDLTLELNGNELIAEVYRLGSSKKDNEIITFIDKVADILSKIENNNFLFLKIKNENFSLQDFDFINLKKRIQTWFNTNPCLHSVLNYNSDIDFEIIYKGKYQATQLVSDTIILKIKSEKLAQKENLSDNEITRKILKYREIVQLRKIPYFLCIETDINSGFHFSDFLERFHHTKTEVLDFEKHKDIWLKKGMGKCWSTLGDFYKYPFLSGILISINNEYKLLLSPLKTQIIYQKKYKETLELITQKFASI